MPTASAATINAYLQPGRSAAHGFGRQDHKATAITICGSGNRMYRCVAQMPETVNALSSDNDGNQSADQRPALAPGRPLRTNAAAGSPARQTMNAH